MRLHPTIAAEDMSQLVIWLIIGAFWLVSVIANSVRKKAADRLPVESEQDPIEFETEDFYEPEEPEPVLTPQQQRLEALAQHRRDEVTQRESADPFGFDTPTPSAPTASVDELVRRLEVAATQRQHPQRQPTQPDPLPAQQIPVAMPVPVAQRAAPSQKPRQRLLDLAHLDRYAIRRAIVLNEVLGPPISLRDPHAQ